MLKLLESIDDDDFYKNSTISSFRLDTPKGIKTVTKGNYKDIFQRRKALKKSEKKKTQNALLKLLESIEDEE